ncbi:MAG: transposase, partial [Bacteroidota bacterium]
YYLIGANIEKEGMPIIEKSYWISFIEESIDGYKKFLDDLNKYCTNDFILFHYGKYEITFLRHLLDITKMQNSNLIVEKLISRSENILSAFLYKIYCPTYSNDLKSISKHLGFTWLSDNVSGLDAIVWRKLWEESNDSQWKDKLINYNLEDCYALKHLVSFIYSLKNENNDSPFSNLNVSQDFTDEIEKRYGGKNFGNKNYVLPDYDYINKKAYFDYQRDKIFIRTNKVFKKVKKSEYKKHFSNKINQEIVLNNQEACIFCSNNKTKVTSQKTERTIIDLKITRNGVKKWIIKYCAYKIYCPKCGKHFSPEKYKEIGKMYGHNLVSWIVYNYIANNTSFEKIEKTLKDCFQISFGETGRSPSQRLKEIAGSYYKETYLKLQTEVRNWHVIHADETRFRLRTSNGYIWVLTNLDTAFFIYRADRTCDFLQEIIENFNGVFISDFYKGYDSLNCAQQKCLIHLLRDINDILFKEQQNNELKIIAQLFNDILRKIVTTIDRYGLKKRNLKKHKKDVMVFYNKVNMIEYKTKYAKALAIRLNRSRPSLFTFLDYDNVPWNNNNAEHSFKHFAVYRKQTNGLFTERSIEDYLILLSLYQTCKYRGINFLKFLLSKEKNICEYQKNYNYAGIKKKNIFEFKKGKNEQHKII